MRSPLTNGVAKVMFSYLSVCHSVHVGGGVTYDALGLSVDIKYQGPPAPGHQTSGPIQLTRTSVAIRSGMVSASECYASS